MSGLAQMLTVFSAVTLAVLADWVCSRLQLSWEARANVDAIASLRLVPAYGGPDDGPEPESLDATRPDDIDVCHACAGEGAVMIITGDPYEGGWDSVECCFCHGTGTLGGAA